MPKHVVVPDEREAQLRQIAQAYNLPSTADAVGILINWAIESGKMLPGLPGIDVTRKGELVELDFGDFKRVMDVELAKVFALSLRWFATPKQGNSVQIALRDVAQMLSGAEVVGISRRGTSIKISGENGAERTLAPSVARDLAMLISNAAV